MLLCLLFAPALHTRMKRGVFPNPLTAVSASVYLTPVTRPTHLESAKKAKTFIGGRGLSLLPLEGEKIEKEKGEEIAARTPISARFPSPNEEAEELLFIPDNEQVVRLSFLLPLRYTSDCQLQRQRELPATRRTEEPEAKNPPTSVFLSRCNKLLPPWLLTTVLHQF